MASYTTERVVSVTHWSDRLFSFRTTRDAGFRFENGQFVMIGLEAGERRVVRAYSIASANHEDTLEFYSIKVANGPLTSRLQHIRTGDEILVSRKPTGTLLIHDLNPGKRLYLLSTGTGAAPFSGSPRKAGAGPFPGRPRGAAPGVRAGAGATGADREASPPSGSAWSPR